MHADARSKAFNNCCREIVIGSGCDCMPISRSEFESGRVLTDLEKAVVRFLNADRDNAYTMGDIMDGINIQTDFSDLWKAILSGIFVFGFADILNNLVLKEEIKSNIVNGMNYYAAK